MSEENEGNGTVENGKDKAMPLKVQLEIPEKTEDLMEAQELLKDLRERASDATGKDMSKASFKEVKEAIAEKQKRKEREQKSGTYPYGGAAGKAPLTNPNETDDLFTHEFGSHKEMLSTLKEMEKSGTPEQKLEAKAVLDEFKEKMKRTGFETEIDLLRPQREKWKEISEKRDKAERGEKD